METNTAGWIGLIVALCLTTFGVSWLLIITISLLLFIIGLASFLHVQRGSIEKFYIKCAGNPLSSSCIKEGGLEQIVKQLESPKKVQKQDSRVTGSELIDSSLQEILGYIIRDYVLTWYNLLTRDVEFTDTAVRRTAQTLAINISNRVKEIDWIPYLTQKFVDDAASHLRLYKQARTKMKLQEAAKEQKSSPQRDKTSPKKTVHKRNKSETDVSWYSGRATELKKDQEKIMGHSKFAVNDDKKNFSLEDHFFYLERQMEKDTVSRDSLCRNLDIEKEFLCELTEIILYILLPDEDFQCKPLRYVLREIFVNGVILPLFNLIADPDYINQAMIWLCLRENQLPTDIFLSILRLTDSCDELKSTKDLISLEIQTLRSRDSGRESDLAVKQQLSSLYYVLKLIDSKLSKMENMDNSDGQSLDYIQLESIKKIDLTLDQILKNNIALSYFIDFVSSQGKQLELFFYLNVEGWKVSVEQQLSNLHLTKIIKGTTESVGPIYENIRSTALSIYDQYLGEKIEQRVQIKPALIQALHFKIRNLNETPSETWFDGVLEATYEKLESKHLPLFKKNKCYVKLLQELDLLQQPNSEDDVISINSNECLEITDPFPVATKKMDFLTVIDNPKNIKHVRSLSDVTMTVGKNESEIKPLNSSQENKSPTNETGAIKEKKVDEKALASGNFNITINIIETGIVCEKGKTFGIYAMRVSQSYDTGYQEEWHIYRRYSDFHDLYCKVKEKFPDLSKLSFPGKKTFHNMDRAVLERRMKMLGSYMNELCQTNLIFAHHGLKDLLMTFVEQGDYDKANGGPISTTIDNLVNPLKSGMKTIKNMPEQLINTVDEVVGGLSKVFHPKPVRFPEACKVGASIEETDDNIPLRIMLLLMDEVFDLKSRNQWLRRRIVTLLRQIVRTMFGDIVNRRILEYVSFITSPKNVAQYLYIFKHSFWPNGMRNDRRAERDEGIKSRTRVAAKIALISCLSDELKHIIGSETTRRGLLTIFDLFQRPILNRRLLYVLLEGILSTLFPEKDMNKLFIKLYSKSNKNEQINTQKSS
ncbi:sorting nexin-13 isoform X1 [Diabrotica virgifera virgifera]|uniref:Sorting nexin-13-like n=1 Tax=Diabrotica virgifera virgifera TaxID=50390 RepID=A0ABM5IX09_DIAVI|nr:sorting nexin-13 isoform X1 [Diabrotica virgifera virgifera]